MDQALTFTSGQGKATINGTDQDVKAGDLMVVPAGTQHQFVNTGPTPLVSVLDSEGHGPERGLELMGFLDPIYDILPCRTQTYYRSSYKRARRQGRR